MPRLGKARGSFPALLHVWGASLASRRGGLCDLPPLPRMKSRPRIVRRLSLSPGLCQKSVDLTHYSSSVSPGTRGPLLPPLTDFLVAVTYRSICLAGPLLCPCLVPGPRGTTASVDRHCWNPNSSLYLGKVRSGAVIFSCGHGICLPFCGLASSATGFMCLWICGGRSRGPA